LIWRLHAFTALCVTAAGRLLISWSSYWG